MFWTKRVLMCVFAGAWLLGCSGDDTKTDSKIPGNDRSVTGDKSTVSDHGKVGDQGTSGVSCGILTVSDVQTTCGSGSYDLQDLSSLKSPDEACKVMFKSTTTANQVLNLVGIDLTKGTNRAAWEPNITSCGAAIGGEKVGTNGCFFTNGNELDVKKGDAFYRIFNGSTTLLVCSVEKLKALATVIANK